MSKAVGAVPFSPPLSHMCCFGVTLSCSQQTREYMRLILIRLEGTSRGSWLPQIRNMHARPLWITQCWDPRGLGWAFCRSLWVTSSCRFLPQPRAGSCFLQGCDSRSKERKSHSASTFPESLKSQDMLEVTDDELGPKVHLWVHMQTMRRNMACSLCMVFMRRDRRDCQILVSTFQKGHWGWGNNHWKWFRKEL